MKPAHTLLLFCLFLASGCIGQIVGPNAYLIGDYVEVGIAGDGGFEGADTALGFVPGTHFRSANPYFGFVADATASGWVQFDGDFFTPGSPENGWGIELGGINGVKANNNCQFYQSGTAQQITGAVSDYVNNAGAMSVCWDGDYAGSGYDVSIHINYSLNQADFFYSTEVTIINNMATPIDSIYYHRNIDPDNNVSLSGDYSTTNTIVSQGDTACSKALVTAEQSTPWNSYIGLAAFGENFRVTYGGFANRDASDIWNYGTTGGTLVGTPGSVNHNDEAISLAYFIENLGPGLAETFRYVVILDSSQTDNALNNLFQFQYAGDLIGPLSQCEPVADTVYTCTSNPVDIQVVGQAVNDFSWTWSPAVGLDTINGTVVNASPATTTTYTATGTPLGSCFTSAVTKDIVVVTQPGPDLQYTDPGRQCNDFDLSTLAYSDNNSIPGTVASFQSGIPESAQDTSLYLISNMMSEGDTVFLVIADTLTGCFDYEQIIIDWGEPFNLSVTAIDADCGLDNGSLEVTSATGGVGPYNYQWIGGPSDSLYNSIGAGVYAVSVTDSEGCTTDTTVILNNIGSAVVGNLVAIQHAECGQPIGEMEVSGSGGLGSYTYDIGAGPQPTGTFTGLTPGWYVVQVEDSVGCSGFVTVNILDTSTLGLELISITPENCSGSNGELEVVGTGGAPAYTYDIGTGPQSSGTFTGLSSGTYSVVVEDIGGCMDTLLVAITDTSNIQLEILSVLHAMCSMANGEIEVQAVTGTGPFTYDIGAGSQASGIFDSLTAGDYVIVASDALGCTDTLDVTINDTSTLQLNILTQVSENCGLNNGAFEVEAGNGVAPYTYSIGAGSQPDGWFDSLVSGVYTVTATDDIGCSVSMNITVVQVPVTIDLGSDITACQPIVLSSPAGTNYSWNTGATTQSITVSSSGQYILDYDFNGCLDSDTVNVTVLPGSGVVIPNVFTPNGDAENDEFVVTALNVTNVHITIYNRWGHVLFESTSLSNAWNGQDESGEIHDGVYFWTATYTDPCEDVPEQVRSGTVHLFR